jgi:hypothetical protein
MNNFKRRHLLYLTAIITLSFLVVTVFSQLQISVQFPTQGTVSSTYEVWAASGAVADIQSAVNNVRTHGGGTVRVPAGNWLFDATPSSYVSSIGGVNIVGAGMFLTNLTLRADATYSGTTMFNIDGANQRPIRISGITFIGRLGAAASQTGDTAINLDVCKDFRVDNCSFHNLGSNGLLVHSFSNDDRSQWLLSQGVIDHCRFYDIYKAGAVSSGNGYGYGVDVEKCTNRLKCPWPSNPNSLMGNATDTVFIENCYFTGCRHSVMTWLGGRTVFRFNTVEKPCLSVDGGQWMIDTHPPRNYDGVDYYAGRWVEVYNNSLTANRPGGNEYGIDICGGSAFITNNTIGGANIYYAYGFDLTTGNGVSQGVLNLTKPWYVYIWNNAETYQQRVYNPDTSLVVQEVNYHFHSPATDGYSYTPYAYPHPLTLTG